MVGEWEVMDSANVGRGTTVFSVGSPGSRMLYDAAENPEELSPAELRSAYDAELVDAIESAGRERAAVADAIDDETIDALLAGESPPLTLSQAAAVLAAADEHLAAEAVVGEVRDHLLMGMTTAVLDVDAVAAGAEVAMTGQEIQQSIEGRRPFDLDDLAAIHAYLARQNEH